MLRQKAVRVRVSSPLEASTVLATGSVSLRTAAGGRRPATTLRLRTLTATVAANSTRTLGLRLNRRQLAAVREALAAGKRPTINVAVEASDAAGNTVRRTLRVRAKR